MSRSTCTVSLIHMCMYMYMYVFLYIIYYNYVDMGPSMYYVFWISELNKEFSTRPP